MYEKISYEIVRIERTAHLLFAILIMYVWSSACKFDSIITNIICIICMVQGRVSSSMAYIESIVPVK